MTTMISARRQASNARNYAGGRLLRAGYYPEGERFIQNLMPVRQILEDKRARDALQSWSDR